MGGGISSGLQISMPTGVSEEQRCLIAEHVVTETTNAREKAKQNNLPTRPYVNREKLLDVIVADKNVVLDRAQLAGLLTQMYGDPNAVDLDCQRVERKLAQLGIAEEAETLSDGKIFIRYPGASVQALLNGLQIRSYDTSEVAFERHFDGSQLVIYPNGATSEILPNGLKIDRYPNGTHLFEIGENQVVRQVMKMPDGSVTLTDADGFKVQLSENGNCVTQDPNGTKTQYVPSDRKYSIDVPNGLRTRIDEAELSVLHVLRDGTTINLFGGNQYVEYADGGRIERKTSGAMAEVGPDGDVIPPLTEAEVKKLDEGSTIIQVLHDGTIIKRLSNGRIHFVNG